MLKAHINSVSYLGQQGMDPQQTTADHACTHWSEITRVKLLLGERNNERIVGLKLIWEAVLSSQPSILHNTWRNKSKCNNIFRNCRTRMCREKRLWCLYQISAWVCTRFWRCKTAIGSTVYSSDWSSRKTLEFYFFLFSNIHKDSPSKISFNMHCSCTLVNAIMWGEDVE